jgi:aerobic carbon-monoxide dehydrogenase medium subunit
MIPAQFDYQVPGTLEEAINLLAQDPDGTKVLAGGHSLIPAMKLRLVQPQRLIDIARIRDLSYIREDGNVIAIGATTTHYELESSDLLRNICPLLPECAKSIGDVQVRNKGTIGGSLAHCDPAGDWPAAAIALNVDIVLAGPNGERTMKAEEFFVDLLTTALQPGEILREIRIARSQGKFGHAYQKAPHPASGFAVVGVAANLTLNGDGSCSAASLGITGVANKAYRPSGAEAALIGKKLDDAGIAAAAAKVCDGVEVNGDLYATAEYRRHLAIIHAARAIRAAASKVS